MAKRAQVYPQVDPGAAALIDVAIAAIPRRARVIDALRLARKREAAVVTADNRVFVAREDLARAESLGLDDLPATALARPLPIVEERAGEIAVRRHLLGGARFVIVRDNRRTAVGAVAASASQISTSLGAAFPARLGAAGDALAAVARTAREHQMPAFVVGGVVRDALIGRASAMTRDLDVVVEGDGLRFAPALAAALGAGPAAMTRHERFLTASVVAPNGARVDVATARAERYDRPGALPRVIPASIGEDLGRRDFTINAMAVELASGAFGVLDPFGGRTALARRRVTILHPLSFVDDPTRIFRAARYAARLGFRLDAWTTRVLGLALRLAPYAALSGQRLAAELVLIVGDERPDAALAQLATAGAFRLLARDYRVSRSSAGRIAQLSPALEWARTRGLAPPALEIAAVAILSGQSAAVTRAALDRLVVTGEPRARLERALSARGSESPARTASARARPLRGLSDTELLARWLDGSAARREVEWFVDVARPVRPTLGGDDVIALGVTPGPAVADALRALRDARLDGRVADRDSESDFVQNFLNRKEG